jgi:hypothetical protein
MSRQRRPRGRPQDPEYHSFFSLPVLGIIFFAISSIADPVQVKTEDKAEINKACALLLLTISSTGFGECNSIQEAGEDCAKGINTSPCTEVEKNMGHFSNRVYTAEEKKKAMLKYKQYMEKYLVHGHDVKLGPPTLEGMERPGASRRSEEKTQVRGDQGPPTTELVMPLFQEELYSEEDPEGDEAEDGSGEGKKAMGVLAILFHKAPGDPVLVHEDDGSGSGDHMKTKKSNIPPGESSSTTFLAVAGCVSVLGVALIVAGVIYHRRGRGEELISSSPSSSSQLSTQLSSNASDDDEEEEQEEALEESTEQDSQEEALDQSTEEPDGVEGGDAHAGEQEEQGGEERDGDISEHTSSGISGTPPLDTDTEGNSEEDAAKEIR